MYKAVTTFALLSFIFLGALFGSFSMQIIPDSGMDMEHPATSECADHCLALAVQDLDVLTVIKMSPLLLLSISFVLLLSFVAPRLLQPQSIRLDHQRSRILTTQRRE